MKFFKKIPKKALAILTVLVVGLGTYQFIYLPSKNKDTAKTGRADKTAQITAKVERGKIISSISVSGTVETANFLPVTTSVNGIVREVFVKEGDKVEKNQKIMEVSLSSDGEESRVQAWGSYLSAKSNLEKAKSDLYSKESTLITAKQAFEEEKENNSYQISDERRNYKLAENTYITAKSGYDLQKETIQQAEIALNKAWLSYQAQSPIIVAPDSGTVANIVVVEGMDITNSLSERTSASVASIKKEGNPIVSLNVSELDINKVSVGQKVEVTLDSVENKVFDAEVVGIDRMGEISGGVANYAVISRFKEKTDLALPNMSVEAKIILQEKESVILAPTSAVYSERGNTYVNILNGQKVTKQKVEIGISDETNTEILSGLKEGDTVVIPILPITGFSEAQDQTSNSNKRNPGIPSGGMMFR